MKNFRLLSIAVLLASFIMTSCSEDEEPTVSLPATATDLIGTWNLSSLNGTTSTTTTIAGTSSTTNSTVTAENIAYEITFTDNTYATKGSYDIKSVISTSGASPIETTTPFKDIEGSGSYSVENGKITTTEGLISSTSSISSGGAISTGPQTADFLINGENNLVMTQSISKDTTINTLPIKIVVNSTSIWTKK